MARKPAAKVMPTRALTWVWPTPSMAYSTGSSMVRILREPSLSRLNAAYRVVVLPEPVGPVTSTMPLGTCNARCTVCITAAGMPNWVNDKLPCSLSRIRSTTRSLLRVGKVDTRTSNAFAPITSDTRPSWGTRFSAISRRAITLTRDTSSGAMRPGNVAASRITPSTRRRTRSRDS